MKSQNTFTMATEQACQKSPESRYRLQNDGRSERS